MIEFFKYFSIATVLNYCLYFFWKCLLIGSTIDACAYLTFWDFFWLVVVLCRYSLVQ